MKPSPTNKDKLIPALAKSDALFQALLNGDNEDVALICEARLKVKSVLERTRAQRFIDISKRGRCPIPLSYYGAATGRFSASKGSNLNMQNMKRGSFLRNSIMAPEGQVVVVGDLSQIEPRVLAWLSGYEAMLEIFRAGGDPYATFGSQMFSIPGLSKETHPLLRQSAKSALLGAGYQLGWASFAGQLLTGFLGAPPQRYTKADAKQLGVTAQDVERFLSWKDNVEKMGEIAHTCTEEELLIHCLAAKAIIDKYRVAAEPVVAFWKFLGERIEKSLVGGEEYDYKGVLKFRKDEIEMVNGMCLRYPDLKMHVDEKDPKKRAIYTYLDGKKRIKLYPGKVCNNCIAEGTPVLTQRGWVPIEDVAYTDKIHDGDNFVSHKGLISKGMQGCVIVDGVYMTPDHEVLTDDGWKTASQFPRPYRPDLRAIDGTARRGERSGWMALAVPVQVRNTMYETWRRRIEGAASWGDSKLRVRDARAYRDSQQNTWQGTHAYMDRMVQYARALSRQAASCVRELWRQGNNGMQPVGYLVRGVLCGHGGYILSGARLGPQGQQPRIHTRELPLGDTHYQLNEPAQYAPYSERAGAESYDRDRTHNTVQPHTSRMADRALRNPPECTKRVFDIVDCGPQQRFVVKGSEGPFIVHNCTQGLARIIMTDGMLRTAKKYRPILTVHDEQGTLAREADAQVAKKFLYDCMVQVPTWMPGIPLDADIGYHRRYGMAKK
jgi:hypothetical protein